MNEKPAAQDFESSQCVIDSHMHYVPRAALAELDLRDLEGLGIRYDPASDRFIRLGESHQGIPSSLFELQEPIDGAGLPVVQVISPWSDLIRDDVSALEGADWCRTLNDALLHDIAGRTGFRAYAALPLATVEGAVQEFERAVSRGFWGGLLPTQIAGRNLDEWGVDALLQASERLDAPIFIHPAKVFSRERFVRHFLRNMCAYPFETTIAAFCLLFSGAFERFPDAKVLLSHCGGTLPFLAGRGVHASDALGGLGRPALSLRDVFEPFYFDCVVQDPQALAFALRQVGPQRMVLGSDGPFTMGLTDPVSHIRQAAVLAGLDADTVVQAVAIDTPARMYGATRLATSRTP